MKILAALVLAASTFTAYAQAAPTGCQYADANVTDVQYARSYLANINFRQDDLLIISSKNASALNAAKAKYHVQGLAIETLCNGMAVIFVDIPNVNDPRVMVVYAKLASVAFSMLGMTEIRPVNKTEALSAVVDIQ